jgi:hypothetical protein
LRKWNHYSRRLTSLALLWSFVLTDFVLFLCLLTATTVPRPGYRVQALSVNGLAARLAQAEVFRGKAFQRRPDELKMKTLGVTLMGEKLLGIGVYCFLRSILGRGTFCYTNGLGGPRHQRLRVVVLLLQPPTVLR